MANKGAKRVVWTSFLVDALDIALNLVIMLVTGSVVMLAEMFQGISDLLASGFLLIGLRRSKKEIYLWTALSALSMLLLAASLSFYYGLQRFLQPEEIESIALAYIALVIAATSNGYAFYVSVKRLIEGRKSKNVIKAYNASKKIMTRNTFVLDLMGMSAALVGLMALILYQLTGELRYDGIGAMAIGVILALLSIDLLVDMFRMRARGAEVQL
jgi:divalent metal cation (Fe/Co/Zn/Cd) transporter